MLLRKTALYFVLLSAVFLAVRAQDDDDDSEEGEDDECENYKCPEQAGSFADPCQCRRFYKCNHGVPTRLLCPSGKA